MASGILEERDVSQAKRLVESKDPSGADRFVATEILRLALAARARLQAASQDDKVFEDRVFDGGAVCQLEESDR